MKRTVLIDINFVWERICKSESEICSRHSESELQLDDIEEEGVAVHKNGLQQSHRSETVFPTGKIVYTYR